LFNQVEEQEMGTGNGGVSTTWQVGREAGMEFRHSIPAAAPSNAKFKNAVGYLRNKAGIMPWSCLVFWPLIGQDALPAADVGSVLNQWQIRTFAKHATPLTNFAIGSRQLKPQGSFVHTQSLKD
jgi:hypothetical protein